MNNKPIWTTISESWKAIGVIIAICTMTITLWNEWLDLKSLHVAVQKNHLMVLRLMVWDETMPLSERVHACDEYRLHQGSSETILKCEKLSKEYFMELEK